jgi:SAM-dependent methyltransferase
MQLEDVRKALLDSIGGSERPAEARFAALLRRHPHLLDLRLARVERVLGLLGGPGGELLDAGSGTGLNAVLAILAGARKVHAVELNPFRLEVAAALIRRLGLEQRVALVAQDVLTVELPAGSLAGVYSNEFLEHIVDSEGFHRRAAQWLAPGGRIFGRTGANGANWFYRVSYGRQYDRTDQRVYLPVRRQRLAALVPEAPAAALEALAAGTRGCGPEEIEAAVAAYRAHGTLPPANRQVPKNPETGVYYERLREPKQLLAEMEAAGFAASLVAPDWRNLFLESTPKRLLARTAGALVAATFPASLPFAPWLEVVGERR